MSPLAMVRESGLPPRNSATPVMSAVDQLEGSLDSSKPWSNRRGSLSGWGGMNVDQSPMLSHFSREPKYALILAWSLLAIHAVVPRGKVAPDTSCSLMSSGVILDPALSGLVAWRTCPAMVGFRTTNEGASGVSMTKRSRKVANVNDRIRQGQRFCSCPGPTPRTECFPGVPASSNK